MATAAEKQAKQDERDAARNAIGVGKARLQTEVGSAGRAFAGRQLRSAGDLSRYSIGGFLDDPVAQAAQRAQQQNQQRIQPTSSTARPKPQAIGTSTNRLQPPRPPIGQPAQTIGGVDRGSAAYPGYGGPTGQAGVNRLAAYTQAANQKAATTAQATATAKAGADTRTSLLNEQARARQLKAAQTAKNKAAQAAYAKSRSKYGGPKGKHGQAQLKASTAAAKAKARAAAAKRAKAAKMKASHQKITGHAAGHGSLE